MSESPSSISSISAQLEQIDTKLDQLTLWMTGNGDPEKGILWQMADLHRTRAERVRADEERDQKLRALLDTRNGAGTWRRLSFDLTRTVIGNVLTLAAVGAVGIFGLGLRIMVSGPTP